jgi:hypothetical protein
MFQILPPGQVPQAIAKQAKPEYQIPALPFDSIPPGGAIKIPFDRFPDSIPALKRIHGALRVRACRASTRFGVRFSVHRTSDGFYITRPDYPGKLQQQPQSW